MFVLFTVVAAWFGWNVHTVQQRTAILASLAQHNISYIVPGPSPAPAISEKLVQMAILYRTRNTFVGGDFKRFPPSAPCRVSTLRRWLGDEPQWLIIYAPGPAPDLVRHLFPEAIVVVGKRKPPNYMDYKDI